MRIYIPSMEELFTGLDRQKWPYVIARGYHDLSSRYPAYGEKRDIDILVSDKAVNYIRDRYARIPRSKGIKCDFYAPSSHEDTDYCGHPYYPGSMATKMLSRRIKWRDRFYVPCEEDHFYSLLYHIAYQKAELSGFAFNDPEPGRQSKYFLPLQSLTFHTGLQTDFTLMGMHEKLDERGYGIRHEVLIDYVKNSFSRKRKSYFYGWLCNRLPGEMNLYVIRKCAVRYNKVNDILDEIRKRFDILMIKPIPWLVRQLKSRHMRGGKWKRGGRPYIAVVVFDRYPKQPTDEMKSIHPHVFNGNQFFKTDIRGWFLQNTNARYNDNVLHSTDNEAEAIGHLSLFFTEQEQLQIMQSLLEKREELQS